MVGAMRVAVWLALCVGSSHGSTAGLLQYKDYAGKPMVITHDKRSVMINGDRAFFASVGIHYPRFTPSQWDDLFMKAKNDGYNMVQTYFFHNAHQPKLTTWPWIQSGPSDLRLFLTKAAAAGFFVDLRIGPYVCAEWSWGGYPYDLAQISDIKSRSSNPAWEKYMTDTFLNVTREYRDLFADKGGPIVLGQVENELHTGDQDYIDFCGELTVKSEVPIAWGMCNGNSANNTINTCNGGSCTKFIESNGQNGRVLIDQPAMWTENWMGWFDSWGGSGPAGHWPTFDSTSQSQSKSRGIFEWVARGGSHVNFYNWAGGNHFARNAGSSMVNIYYWDAPIAADNLAQGPERLHMARMYAALAKASSEILSSPAQLNLERNLTAYGSDGSLQPNKVVAYVYGKAAFIENRGGNPFLAEFNGVNYTVGSQASLLLLDGEVLFSTSDVQGAGTHRAWDRVQGLTGWKSWTDTVIPTTSTALPPPTPAYTPWSGSALGRVIRAGAPLEAVNFTEYDSELALYIVELTADDLAGLVAESGDSVNLTLASARAQVWTVFANGKMVGSGSELSHHGGQATIAVPITTADLLPAKTSGPSDTTVLALLSTSVGIDNGGGVNTVNGTFSSTAIKGITQQSAKSVLLGSTDLTNREWTHVVGADGETKAVFTDAGAKTVEWTAVDGITSPPMTWLTTTFTTPPSVLQKDAAGEINTTLNLDVVGLGRGRFFINGMDLGRYWSKICGSDVCQRYYPVPFDILKADGSANTLTVLDETGATNLSSVGLALSVNVGPKTCGAPQTSGQIAAMAACSSSTPLAVTPKSNGLATISPKINPSLCLTAPSSANTPSGPVLWSPCSPGEGTQLWSLPAQHGTIAAASPTDGSLCLDITGQNATEFAEVGIWPCSGNSNQEWAVQATGDIVSDLESYCLAWAC